MLRQIKATNFRSVKELDLTLGQLTIFIGPNNAGKTNILDILRFLKPHSEAAYRTQQVVHFGAEEISIALTMKDDTVWDTSARLRQGGLRFGAEKLFHPGLIFPSGSDKIFETNGTEIRMRVLTEQRIMSEERLMHDPANPALYAAASMPSRLNLHHELNPMFVPLANMVHLIDRYSVYSLEPSRLRAVQGVVEQLVLSELGDNLSQVLHTYHSKYRRRSFDRIEEQVRSIVPAVTELVSDLRGSHTSVALREEASDSLVPSDALPDGVLKLIGLLTILNAPNKPPIIAIEEPENYIHPYAQGSIAKLLHEYAEKHQVMLTTHSPSFLNHFDLKDIVVVRKTNGVTIAERPKNAERLRKALDELGVSVGDAWFAGHLEES